MVSISACKGTELKMAVILICYRARYPEENTNAAKEVLRSLERGLCD